MLEDGDIPLEGIYTDQWLWSRPAKVWWQREVMLAFPKAEDRVPILGALENTMIACGTATLYYHLERIAEQWVKFESADDDEVIYVNVELGAPMIVDVPDELLPSRSSEDQ
ncbi:hypothetical protein [Tabrizicola soli]|uniref:Uncharacterized protein n=2 Tax=Tabrizicola soli TaxID=2185115 RepID=A0ABV7DYA0_9RHOB